MVILNFSRLWEPWLVKVAQRKKRLCICSHHTANLKFLFLSLCVYLFKNCPFQFLSHWESADPVFCSSLPCKNQNKSLTLSYLVGKFKFPVRWDHIHKCFFQRATFCPQLLLAQSLAFSKLQSLSKRQKSLKNGESWQNE